MAEVKLKLHTLRAQDTAEIERRANAQTLPARSVERAHCPHFAGRVRCVEDRRATAVYLRDGHEVTDPLQCTGFCRTRQ